MTQYPDHRDHQDAALTQHLRTYLGEIEPAALALLREHLSWVEIAAGETLMAQGAAGDSMYLVVSGRLRATVLDAQGAARTVREMGRGQVIGEMSLYTGEPRSASVVAVRDSVLVRLEQAHFAELLASSAQVSLALTRQIIARLRTPHEREPEQAPVMLGLLAITPGVDLRGFAEALAAQLGAKSRVRILDAQALDLALGEPGAANGNGDDAALNRRIALALDAIEAEHDFVLLLGDATPSAWTRRACCHSDELLLVADAASPPVLHAVEQDWLARRPAQAQTVETLVLLHGADTRCPRGTRAWLQRRAVALHVHIRPTLDRDMARLARIQSRTAVGLVLAGGGARGFAHLGVYRALQEHGTEIDFVGGTSIGAVMATLVASDQPLAQVLSIARRAFHTNPTGDFNWLPLLSLIRGRRLRAVVNQAVGELLGFPADVEDLWKNTYFVASNYSQAREQVLRSGPLQNTLLASAAIPGALPPVIHDGDLLCDGGTFNNFPVDVMRKQLGVGHVIGVDLRFGQTRRIDYDELPGMWALLRDRLRPRHRRRYRQLPSLIAYLLNVTILVSASRRANAQALTDQYFNPPLHRVGLLDWRRFDSVVAQGYAHAVEVLRPPETATKP